MKARVRAAGRDPDHCAILPAIAVIVAPTEEQAQREVDVATSFAVTNITALPCVS